MHKDDGIRAAFLKRYCGYQTGIMSDCLKQQQIHNTFSQLYASHRTKKSSKTDYW